MYAGLRFDEHLITQLAIRQTRLWPTAAITDDSCILKFCLKAPNANQDRKLGWRRAKITSDFLGEFVKVTLSEITTRSKFSADIVWHRANLKGIYFSYFVKKVSDALTARWKN